MMYFLCVALLFTLGQNAPAARYSTFSGRWRLVPAKTAELQALPITAADELIVTQTATSISIEHPSKSGTHPKAANRAFGSQGFVAGDGGDHFRRDVFWFGKQFVIGEARRAGKDAAKLQVTGRSELWELDADGNLS